MSNFVKVEYEIHDVIVEKVKRKNRVKIATRTMSDRPKTQSSTTPRQASINPEPRPASIKEKRPSIINPAPPTPPINEEEVRANLHNRPHSASKRYNPLDRRRPVESPWQFSTVGIDRDLALLEQDLKISKFKLAHPSPYDDSPEKRGDIAITPRESHLSKSEKGISCRDRLDSKTSGNILNNNLPFHPHLKENLDHGIHDARWNVMTALEDDPERLKPTIHVQTKSHSDFANTFNSFSWSNKTLKNENVEIFRKDKL